MITQFLSTITSWRTHTLIILQNNNELRATGGFITSVIDISRFHPRFLNVFTDLSNHPPEKGPAPLMEMLNDGYLNGWYLRDANFSPEFSESAEKIIHFYNLNFPKNKVKQLIAINFSLIEKILKITGPIRIKGQSINHNTVFYFLSAEVSDIDRHSIEALNNRKKILKQFGAKLIKKILLSPHKWLKILTLLKQSLTTKDLQIHNPKKPQKNFTHQKNEDFFSLIESNFLGLKSNRYLKKTLFHDTTITADNTCQHEVRIVWEHLGNNSFPLSGPYHAYVRLYTNKDYTLAQGEFFPHQNQISTHTEGDHLVITAKIHLQPQEKTILNLVFTSPLRNKHGFSFKYFKQPGSIREHFHKTVTFPETSILSSSSKKLLITEHLATYDESNLEKNISFTLKKSAKHRLPRITSHRIVSPTTIEVEFSNPIAPPKKDHPNIKLTPKGKNHPLTIEKTTLINNKTLQIIIKDLPNTPEKFYSLTLKNLLLTSGETMYQKERTVTVVYRPKYFK